MVCGVKWTTAEIEVEDIGTGGRTMDAVAGKFANTRFDALMADLKKLVQEHDKHEI